METGSEGAASEGNEEKGGIVTFVACVHCSPASVSPVSTPTTCEATEELPPTAIAELLPFNATVTNRLAPQGMNPTRTKFRNLLYNDFKDKVVDMNSSVAKLVHCIVDVESSLNAKYNKGDAISQEYRSRFRDIRFNLQKNKRLLGDLLFGELVGEKLAVMSSEEMLSDEIKKEVCAAASVHV